MKHLNKTILLVAAICCSLYGFAQKQAVGSVGTYGGSSTSYVSFYGTSADISETVYIGPGEYTINGIWQLYAKNIIISSAAKINGEGKIEIYNPEDAGGEPSPTLIDGNFDANAIGVNVELNNPLGMQLTNANLPSEFTGAGWTENTAASTLALSGALNLNINGANVTLGSGVKGDLIFTPNGSIANYGPDRMIVTNNSVLSHVVKQNYTSGFVFPVGINANDYCPARVSNASAVDVSVSVQDYTNSASDETLFTDYGMRRTWHIYGSAAGTGSTITLQHNSVLNETKFDETKHFVSKYNSTANAWQENSPGPGAEGSMRQAAPANSSRVLAVPGSSEKSSSYSVLPTSSESPYFTKRTAQTAAVLPIKIISFNASAQACEVSVKLVAELDNDVRAIELQRGSTPGEFTTIYEWTDAGTSGVRDFTFSDKQVESGQTYYYRVKIGYKTGSFEYSGAAAAKAACSSGQTITLFPNPANGFINIRGMPANTRKIVQVIDMSGKTWHQLSTASSEEQLNVLRLPDGTYVIRIFNEDGTVYLLKKFTKL